MRSELLRGIRPVDAALATGLGGLATVLAVLNIGSHDQAVRVDSHSWLLLPAFLATALPVLWWRRGLVAVTAVCCAAMAGHVLAFGSLVRCGSGLPLAFVLAFLAGLPADRRERLTAAGLSAVLCALVLVRDTAAGVGLLPLVLVVAAGLYGVGRVVAHRAELAADLRRRNEDLRRLRDERAALGVSGDRLELSARLEALLDQRLGQLASAAASAPADAAGTRALLATLEEDSRRTLDDMREIVGTLRGGEVRLAPVPSVASLDALLARHLPAGGRLQVSGAPRLLPASVELSAYRIVEHLVTAFARDPAAGVRVGLRFGDDAVEIDVTGPASRGADLRAAVARARERALLHAGSLSVRTVRGRSQVVALLPVPAGG